MSKNKDKKKKKKDDNDQYCDNDCTRIYLEETVKNDDE